MKKQSTMIGVSDIDQKAIQNIELRSLIISIILGGAGATLFFLNSLNKINQISITIPKLIVLTFFLWAFLAFVFFTILLQHSQIIKFLRQKSLRQFIGWFILISIPFLLTQVQYTTQNYDGLLISMVFLILIWGLFGLILAAILNDLSPLHLVIKQIKLVMIISFIISVILYIALLSAVAAENRWSFLNLILNWTTWGLFLKYIASGYWFICSCILFFWSILYLIKQQLKELKVELKAWSFSVISKLKYIEQFLIKTLRIHPLIVRISIVLVIYFVETYLVNALFDSILWEFGTHVSFDFSSFNVRQFLTIFLLVLVVTLPLVLFPILGIILIEPNRLKQAGLLINNKKQLLILFVCLILLISIILLLIFLPTIATKFGIQTLPSFLTIQQFVAFVLLSQGALLLSSLTVLSTIYLTLPDELKRINLHNNIQRMIVILFLLFILWWIFWGSLAQNIVLWNQNAFTYVDGRTWKPNILDFLFYTFALMTSASYIELKPMSFGSHILVMAVTVTGLALLIIFVGVALSDKSPRIRRRRKI